MLNISSNNVITIVRGDSASFTVSLNVGTVLYPELYEMQVGDKVYFGLMEANQPFEKAILKKVFTIDDVTEEGSVTVTLEPCDTECLLCGTYYYSIKLENNQPGEYSVSTVIPKRKFIIEE